MGSKAPSPPNPYAVAAAQTGTNINTAKAQQQLGMTDVQGPTGSTQYVVDPNSPSGYSQVNTLSPEQQALLNQYQTNQANVGQTIGQQAGRVNTNLETPLDLSKATGTNISDIQKTFLDPQWNEQQTQLETQLANQGIAPGSDEYAIAMRQFNQQKQDAYNKMYLGAYGTAQNQALEQYELPEQMLASLEGGGSAPQMPSTSVPSSPGVAPTDLSSLVGETYNAQVANANAALGGIYGLGGAALGGWAKNGFNMPSWLTSATS